MKEGFYWVRTSVYGEPDKWEVAEYVGEISEYPWRFCGDDEIYPSIPNNIYPNTIIEIGDMVVRLPSVEEAEKQSHENNGNPMTIRDLYATGFMSCYNWIKEKAK